MTTFLKPTALLFATLAAAPLLLSAHPASANVRAAIFMARVDVNDDGLVSREEVRLLREDRFYGADLNGDGLLDPSDAPSSTRRGAQFMDFMSMQDANQDGVVTFEEFAAGPMPVFDAADVNQDEVLTGAEIDAFMDAARAQ